ncbi:MAG: substrate-binding domain-containing protein [Clostridiales bacterium]|nr:substrate-binding domain-containing protein [Clostridiales bacterium]
MKKLTAVIAVVLVMVFALAACSSPSGGGGSSSGGGGGGDASDLIIGYNAGSDYIEFFINVIGGMRYEAEQRGLGFVTVTSDFDPERIIPNTEQLLMQGAQVVVDFNVNAEIGGNIVEVVKESGGAGVISIDVEYFTADGTDQAWFMGINNQRAGELCGEAIGDALAEQGRDLEYLVLFFNSENGDLVKRRMGGAIDGLANRGVTLTEDQIVWIDMGGGGSDTTLVGRDKFSAWLTANPDVRTVAVVAVNDETTQGVFAAAETANRTQDCLLASHNVSEQFKELARQGNDGSTWLGSVAYHPEMYGEYIVPLAMDIFTGANTNPAVQTLMDPRWVSMAEVLAYDEAYEAYIAKW